MDKKVIMRIEKIINKNNYQKIYHEKNIKENKIQEIFIFFLFNSDTKYGNIQFIFI